VFKGYNFAIKKSNFCNRISPFLSIRPAQKRFSEKVIKTAKIGHAGNDPATFLRSLRRFFASISIAHNDEARLSLTFLVITFIKRPKLSYHQAVVSFLLAYNPAGAPVTGY